MSKYSEMVALLEWATAKRAEKPPKRRRKRDIDFDPRDFDVTTFIHKEIERAENLKKLLNNYEKINKKEEKKEEKKFHSHQIAMFLVLTFPVTAPLYVAYIKALLQ